MKETEKKKDVKLALCILLSLGISFFFLFITCRWDDSAFLFILCADEFL